MKSIIKELKKDMEIDGGWGQDKESIRSNKHKRVMEAVDKGLLQVHGTAPNSKQDGIFHLMFKKCKWIQQHDQWEQQDC